MKTMGRKISTAIALLIFTAAWIPNVAKAQVKLSDDDTISDSGEDILLTRHSATIQDLMPQ